MDTADVGAVDAELDAAGRDTRAGHWPNGGRFTSADAYLPIDTTPATLTVFADTLVADVVVRHGSATEVRLSDG